ncbi:MAG: hypothetical protein MZV70_00980 [Desulfobacterales bacterium]|nr:hypothetical protein [Desulfobacterales bacterium]
MHQPYYKDDLTGAYSLPWVRLHGVKDYLRHGRDPGRFPGHPPDLQPRPFPARRSSTDYVENSAADTIPRPDARNPPSDMKEGEKIFVRREFLPGKLGQP